MAADLPVLGSFTANQQQGSNFRDGLPDEESLTMMVRGDVLRDCDDATLTEAFSVIAPVKSVRVVRDRGFAFVDFNSLEDSARVLEIAKTEHVYIMDEPVFVSYSRSNKKPSEPKPDQSTEVRDVNPIVEAAPRQKFQ